MTESHDTADSTAFFEQQQLWGRPPEPYQIRVREDILRIIGKKPESILDLGCGDGVVANALPREIRVVGVDTSAAALRHLQREHVHASAEEVPFDDGAFDLVMANDLLEHLDDTAMRAAIKEIRRVARRWILITVPFMEFLESGRTRCGACGHLYHVNHHLRAFGVPELLGLFPDYKPLMMVFSGASQDPLELVQRELRARFQVLNHWDLAVCPKCNARASQGSQPELCALVDQMAREWAPLETRRHPDRSECIAVFSLDGIPLASLPATRNMRISLVRHSNSAFEEMPASLEMQQGDCILCSDYVLPIEKGLYLRQTAKDIDFLYSEPPSDLARGWRVPAWFNASDLMEWRLQIRFNGTDRFSLLPFAHSMTQADETTLSDRLKLAVDRNDQLAIELQNARAENSVLKLSTGRLEQCQVELQNLRLENDQLKLAAGRSDQLAIELQNARAENNVLKVSIGRLEQIQVEIQNLRLENDQLKLAAGRNDQLAIELQNVRAENDAFKLAQGRMEQLIVELQNVRAENDSLKLRAGRCDALEVELLALRQRMDQYVEPEAGANRRVGGGV